MDKELNVRIELRDNLNKHVCNFTILYSFKDTPIKGDYIVIKDSSLTVTGRCHYIENDQPKIVILTSSFISSSYNDLLAILDWFKDHYTIVDLTANCDPPIHYNLYRSIINVADIKRSELDFSDDGDLERFCSAALIVIMTETNTTTLENRYKLCKPWYDLLKILLKNEIKRNNIDFNAIDIIEAWCDQLKDMGGLDCNWVIDIENCEDCANYIKNRLSV